MLCAHGEMNLKARTSFVIERSIWRIAESSSLLRNKMNA